jgi:hypothetical protein
MPLPCCCQGVAEPGGYNAAMSDNLPPGVFRDPDAKRPDQHGSDSTGDGIKVNPDFKDFFAITIAVYQIVLGPILLIVGVLMGFTLLIGLWAR